MALEVFGIQRKGNNCNTHCNCVFAKMNGRTLFLTMAHCTLNCHIFEAQQLQKNDRYFMDTDSTNEDPTDAMTTEPGEDTGHALIMKYNCGCLFELLTISR